MSLLSRVFFLTSNDFIRRQLKFQREANARHETLMLNRIAEHYQSHRSPFNWQDSRSFSFPLDFPSEILWHSSSDKKSFKWQRLAKEIINFLLFKKELLKQKISCARTCCYFIKSNNFWKNQRLSNILLFA